MKAYEALMDVLSSDAKLAAKGTNWSPIVLAVCGALVSGIMVFGSPVLWVTEEEARMSCQEVLQHIEAASGGQQGDASISGSASANAVAGEPSGRGVAPSERVPLVSFRTTSMSTDERRTANLEIAADALNGYEIAAGAAFSFNEVVGDVATDERYQLAHVVAKEGVVEERGGGVDQVASTLYNAALRSGLVVVERHPHEAVTDFVAVGLDAFVSYGEKDLVVQNPGTYPVCIFVETKGNTVTVTIEGQPLEAGLTIDVRTKVVDLEGAEGSDGASDDGTGSNGSSAVRDAPGHDSAADAAGTASDSTGTSASSIRHYVTETWRFYYRNGIKAGEELLSSDTYLVPAA